MGGYPRQLDFKIQEFEKEFEKLKKTLEELKKNSQSEKIFDARNYDDAVGAGTFRKVQFIIPTYGRNQKFRDLVARVFGIRIKEVTFYGEEVICYEHQFARFIIERNELGLQNTVKDLGARILD